MIISALQFDLTSINAPGIVIQFDHQTNCTVPETAVMRSSYQRTNQIKHSGTFNSVVLYVYPLICMLSGIP